jgi:gluconokinase
MGVTGCGKSTLGYRLADRLGAVFLEGDKFHPAANIEKMSRGLPLDDADRMPWLDRLADELKQHAAEGRSAVLTCSALKRAYRDRLIRGVEGATFVHLHGDKALIAARLAARTDHFMPPALLDSQFAALEMPAADEPVVPISTVEDPATILDTVVSRLGLS